MSEYISKHPTVSVPKVTQAGQNYKRQSISAADAKRFRIRMYFESTCPHCKRMMQTLKSLQMQGYFVEAYQIDDRSYDKALFPIATGKANPEDIKKYGIESVPFTLIADLKEKTVSQPITGFQSVDEIKNIMSLLKQGSKKGGHI